MSKNIKITEEQYKMLQEADENMFPYVTDSNFKPFDGYDVTANGKIDGETPATKITTGDKISREITPQGCGAYNFHNRVFATMLREMDTNDADDFDETNGFDYIEKMKEHIQIPKPVQDKMNLLLNVTNGLQVNQYAIILYDLINAFTSQSTNNQSRKVFDSLLREFQKRTGLSKSIEKELENAD